MTTVSVDLDGFFADGPHQIVVGRTFIEAYTGLANYRHDALPKDTPNKST